MAMAWAPPIAYTSSTPSSAQAARIAGCGQPAMITLGWARDGQPADAGLLRGHDVHDDAARVHGEPARNVEPDPLDRHPAFGDGATGHDDWW